MNQPTTPPRRVAGHPSHQHLHRRTASNIHFSPPPTSTGTRSSPTYRLMRESPRSRLAASVAGANDFVGQRAREGALASKRRILALAAVTVVLFVLAQRQWNGDSLSRRTSTLVDISVLTKTPADETVPDAFEQLPLAGEDGDGTASGRAGLGAEKETTQKPDRWVKIAKPSRPDSARPNAESLQQNSPRVDLDGAKFIFVGWMGEQETKAQAHLYQLGLLALATNRTLVLPGVRRSRFGSCYLDNDFSLYYKQDTFDRFGIPYVTSSDFSVWMRHQDETPTAQMISLIRGDPAPLDSLDATAEHFCLDRWRLDWTRHEHRAFFLSSMDRKSPQLRADYGRDVVSALVQEQASVLVVQYNLRFPFLTPQSIASLSPYEFRAPQPYSYFPYSSHWIKLGHAIADQISPFVGVHWRTETLEVERIASCGIALVEQLRKIRKENPAISTLYLATDYPLDFIRRNPDRRRPRSTVVANSGTMSKLLTPAHHDAMRSFLSLLEGENEDDSFHLTTFLEESRLVPLEPQVKAMLGAGGGGVESLDPAIAGLVDKIVLSNAELFYAGLPVSDDKVKGCAKLSQFTTQIIAGRKESLSKSATEDEETRLWNDVGHFSLR